MLNKTADFWFSLLLWLLILLMALVTRTILPVDETRYLSVAWEMWISNNFLVPQLNGEAYSHKPPLLFWLIHLGWSIFGVNELWPRLVAPLFGLGCLLLTRKIAKLLWPHLRDVGDLSLLVLLGSLFWITFATLTMFDLLVSFFVLCALTGIIISWQRGQVLGFVIFSISIGLGGLAKGPVILVHTLPVALLVPYLGNWLHVSLKRKPLTRWYLALFLSIVFGVLIVLCWALPAGYSGGEAYQNAIFFGQTVGRMAKSFAHERPWWWYFMVLPALFLPWTFWPSVWRSFFLLKISRYVDSGVLFCLCWFFSALFIFSLISGKQLHYLLPEFSALALLISYFLLLKDSVSKLKYQIFFPCLISIICGLAIIILPNISPVMEAITWLEKINWGWGALAVLIGLWGALQRKLNLKVAVRNIVIGSAGLVITVHLALNSVLASNYNLKPLAQQIRVWQDQGYAIANFGKYHGQYNFLGRLKSPITVIGVKAFQKIAFLKAHPNGRIIAYYKVLPSAPAPIKTVQFRQMTIAVWDASSFRTNPRLGDRRENK